MSRRDRLLPPDLGFFLGFLLLCNSRLILHVRASIHEYSNEAFIPKLNSFFFHGGSEGLYASKIHDPGKSNSSDTSSSSSPSKGKSFIRFESITFRRTKESVSLHHDMQQRTGLVEAIIVEIRDREKIGGTYLNSDGICCTPALARDGSCKVGEVIIQSNPDSQEWPKRIQTFFEGKNEEVRMTTKEVEIKTTGMYYLYFMFCDPQLKGTTITGRTVWRNPEGYLPGKMAPMMTFYGFMSLAYLVLGLIWFLRFVRYWKDILQLHYHITVVIALGMCEMAFWYFEYANFNSTGTRPMGITMWAVTVSAVKKTVSRLLLLVVSMGYGVVRPTLGGITSKVALLGVIYFMATEALELVEHLGNINDFSGKAKLFLVLPVAILDACFILWIFSSLSKTLEKLQYILKIYEVVTGQEVNLCKSAMAGVHIMDHILHQFSQILKCKIQKLLMSSLGLLLCCSILLSNFLDSISDKIFWRLDSWKGKMLPFWGRITLIEAALSSLPIHAVFIQNPSLCYSKMGVSFQKILMGSLV